MSSDLKYLSTENAKATGDFLQTALWREIEACLWQRRPSAPVSMDDQYTAAAKGLFRAGYEECMKKLLGLPGEAPELNIPEIPPTLSDPRD